MPNSWIQSSNCSPSIPNLHVNVGEFILMYLLLPNIKSASLEIRNGLWEKSFKLTSTYDQNHIKDQT